MTTNEPHFVTHQRRWALLAALSVVLFLVSVAGSFLFFVQPWATCTDSESSAGCPVTGVQVYAQTATFLFVPASGLLVVIAGLRALKR